MREMWLRGSLALQWIFGVVVVCRNFSGYLLLSLVVGLLPPSLFRPRQRGFMWASVAYYSAWFFLAEIERIILGAIVLTAIIGLVRLEWRDPRPVALRLFR